MANHRDRHDLYEEYKTRVLSDPNAGIFQGGAETSIPKIQATAGKLRCTTAIQKKSAVSYNNRKNEHKESKCRQAAKRNTCRKKAAVKEETDSEKQLSVLLAMLQRSQHTVKKVQTMRKAFITISQF